MKQYTNLHVQWSHVNGTTIKETVTIFSVALKAQDSFLLVET